MASPHHKNRFIKDYRLIYHLYSLLKDLNMAGEHKVTVSENNAGKFSNLVTTSGGHSMNADEPFELGGSNTGATPYDFLLAALGSCKSITMRMYADRKGYKLKHVEVSLSHKKIHADDCESCETKKGMIDLIQSDIRIIGDLTDKERQKIYDIAERCPVHRTITNEILIKSALID